MSDKVRNVFIATAVVVATLSYAIPAATKYQSDKEFENARIDCLREGGNAEDDYGYAVCMRYKGYHINLPDFDR